MKAVFVAGTVLALAGAAMGQHLRTIAPEPVKQDTGQWDLPPTRGTTNTLVNFPTNNVPSVDPLFAPGNTVINFDLAAAVGLPSGSPVTMTSIGWDVTLEAISPSWLSELVVYFDDNIAPDAYGLFLTPGVGNSFPGTANFASGGQIDLSDNGIPNIVLPNGILRMEFFESFDDFPGGVDGFWRQGVLIVGVAEVPAPGALALLGLGGLLAGRRRR